MPREIRLSRVTFKYGLGTEFIDVLRTLHKLGLDSTEPVKVRGMDVSPRDVVAAALPDPRRSATGCRGKTCAGTLVTGKRKDGSDAVYLYHVADNERTMAEYGHQAVVLQTAINPVIALELLAAGTWQGAGVLGPESFRPIRSSSFSPTTASHWNGRGRPAPDRRPASPSPASEDHLARGPRVACLIQFVASGRRRDPGRHHRGRRRHRRRRCGAA